MGSSQIPTIHRGFLRGGLPGHLEAPGPGDEGLGRGLPGGHHGDLQRQDRHLDGGPGDQGLGRATTRGIFRGEKRWENGG